MVTNDETKPVRVQLSRKRGWRMPDNMVRVCRPGIFGNPFRVGPDGDAAECLKKFEEALRNDQLPNLPYKPGHCFGWMNHLRGKNLACWCKLGEPCHADVLLRVVNENSL
jgi:hypothetical protein